MSEFSDLYSAQGEVVRRHVPREEAEALRHIGPYMGIVIVVIVNDKGDILYHRRHPEKRFEPDMYDHVCGGIHSHQSPEEAAMNEAQQEVGVTPIGLSLISEGVNPYGFYRFLFRGTSNDEPSFDPEEKEVIFADYASLTILRQMKADGEVFVDDFFSDIQLAGLV